ncbi:MAG TPA: response regulator [Euzebyales bacterium]|nr:response regulator [Euzebyales bacterium]
MIAVQEALTNTLRHAGRTKAHVRLAVRRRGVRVIVVDEGPAADVVGEAADGEAAVDLARTTRPDVVLMDIRMPGTDGIDATRCLAGAAAVDPVKVLILTTFDAASWCTRPCVLAQAASSSRTRRRPS